jgi:uncharacterized membrane protein YhaH (DUF805 family)
MKLARHSFAWVGLAVGILAIAISTGAGYSAAGKSCGMEVGLSALIAFACLALAFVGALIAVPAWRAHGRPQIDASPRQAEPIGLVAAVSLWSVLLFMVMIALQAAAGLIISGCQT